MIAKNYEIRIQIVKKKKKCIYKIKKKLRVFLKCLRTRTCRNEQGGWTWNDLDL